MSFINAIAAAPEGTDFLAYKTNGSWAIARTVDGHWEICATLDNLGYPIFVAGVAARGMNLWSYESRMFIVGDVGQLDREED